MMAETVEAIIQQINHSHAQLVRLYHSVPVTAILEPSLAHGNSVKDVVAKIAAWEWRCAQLLAQSHESNGPLLARPDVAELNQEIYTERKSWSWQEVELDFRAAHQQLIVAIRALPESRLNDYHVYNLIAHNTWLEYERYLPDLEQWHQTKRKYVPA